MRAFRWEEVAIGTKIEKSGEMVQLAALVCLPSEPRPTPTDTSNLPLVALSSVWPTTVSRPSHRPCLGCLLHFLQVTVLAAFPGFLLAGKYVRTVRKRSKVRPTGGSFSVGHNTDAGSSPLFVVDSRASSGSFSASSPYSCDPPRPLSSTTNWTVIRCHPNAIRHSFASPSASTRQPPFAIRPVRPTDRWPSSSTGI